MKIICIGFSFFIGIWSIHAQHMNWGLLAEAGVRDAIQDVHITTDQRILVAGGMGNQQPLIWGDDTLKKPYGGTGFNFVGEVDRRGNKLWAKKIDNFGVNYRTRFAISDQGTSWFVIDYHDSLRIGEKVFQLGGQGLALGALRSDGSLDTLMQLTTGVYDIMAMKADRVGNVYVAGRRFQPLYLSDTTLNSNNQGFVLKFNLAYARAWILETFDPIGMIEVDAFHHLYVSQSGNNFYAAKLSQVDTRTGTKLWVLDQGNTPYILSRMAVARNGDLYGVGIYAGNLQWEDFHLEAVNPLSVISFFFIRLDSMAHVKWIRQPERHDVKFPGIASGPCYQVERMIQGEAEGVWMMGQFIENWQYGATSFSSAGTSDGFLIHLTEEGAFDRSLTVGKYGSRVFLKDFSVNGEDFFLAGELSGSLDTGSGLLEGKDGAMPSRTDGLMLHYGACPMPVSTWNSSTYTICDSLTLATEVDVEQGDYKFRWYKDDILWQETSAFEVQIYEAGRYHVEVEHLTCDQRLVMRPVQIDRYPDIPQPTIDPVDDRVLAIDISGEAYEWIKDGEMVVDTSQTLIIQDEGSYTVRVRRGPCWSDVSAPYMVETVSIDLEEVPHTPMVIYPQPTQTQAWQLRLLPSHRGGTLHIRDGRGRDVYVQKVHPHEGVVTVSQYLNPGIYWVTWASEGKQMTQKLFIGP
ncbi:MAG: T9SS type A sorting domain-containing protein [Bacteroidota bacterium]